MFLIFQVLIYVLLSKALVELKVVHTDNNQFHYFSYGSSMYSKRMELGRVNYTFHGIAQLQNHRLDFVTEVQWWNGAIPTICKEPGESVWGVIYLVSWTEKPKLDEQEGVYRGWFHEETVTVSTNEGVTTQAITFVQNHSPRKIPSHIPRPPYRRPSTTYLKVMILGATEAGIPTRYIDALYNIPHNGRRADESVLSLLGPPFLDFRRPAKAERLIPAVRVLF